MIAPRKKKSVKNHYLEKSHRKISKKNPIYPDSKRHFSLTLFSIPSTLVSSPCTVVSIPSTVVDMPPTALRKQILYIPCTSEKRAP